MIRLINCFEVPAGSEEDFLLAWREVNQYMAEKPGYLGHRLHRALAPDAHFRFVNYVEWERLEDCQAAHDAGFRALVGRETWRPFRSTRALYEVAHEGASLALGDSAA